MIFPFSLKEREIEMKKRVYTLYRVSTKGQVEKDDIPMQKESCRDFAESQGWEIVKEFSEKGVSGFKKSAKERDELQKIQQAAMEGKFDILLVFMFDRLGRRDDETPFIVEWFTKQGIEVWSVNEGQQRFDTHVDKLMNYIRYWQASGESLKTSVRTRTRLEQLTGEGHYTGGTVPYGYSGLLISAPPLPRLTEIIPAPFSCCNNLRMTTGFVLMLDARKSLVTLFVFLNVSMQTSAWSAIVNRLDICIKPTFPNNHLYLFNLLLLGYEKFCLYIILPLYTPNSGHSAP